MRQLQIQLGNIPLEMKLYYKDAADYFRIFARQHYNTKIKLSVSDIDWFYAQKKDLPRNGQIEASIMTALASDALLPFNRVIIHAVAFTFEKKAWLITAAPQVGKSTQIQYLMNLYPGEFSVICGDRPVLQKTEDGGFIVHPSPWNGKENWYGAPTAPLAGIFCLERSETTSIRKLKKRDAVLPILSQLISTWDTEEHIQLIAEFETALINSVPIYEYHNGGVPDSTRILYDFLTGATK